VSSVGSFFSYVNDARSHEPEVCKTLIKPILAYGPKTWTVTMAETDMLRLFERNIVRKIYGPVKEERWRTMTIQEITNMLQEEDVVIFIKTL